MLEDVANGTPGIGQSESVRADQRARGLGALEAILLVATTPIPSVDLAHAMGLTEEETEDLLRELRDEYAGRTGGRIRGFELRSVGGGWRLYTNPEYADVVAGFVLRETSTRLSTAALETLAIIAYRQPVSRAQIAAIRGVSVDSVVRTLMMRGLVAEVGTTPASGAVLYGTTQSFLESMGMNSLDELAPLAPYLPEVSELNEVEKELR
ncbi:SMC-Scp complex subunit ScpB [Actinomycetaceae bacterium L2_0104]